MRVVLIGRGRLATNLLPALQQAGHEVSSINSRTLENLPEEADVFIIAVKDSALQEVICRATKGREQQLFVHTAGSMPMSLFEGYTNRFGVFYPMQTFSKERLVSFANIPVFIEGDNAVLRPLAESITHSVYELSCADWKYLHPSAVFACNFVNHCYALSAELLEKHGIPFSVMLPLIDETALKVHQLHPLEAQTGPAVRYDENVIRMQSSMLADSPLLQEIYNLLSVSIHRKSERND